MSDEPKFSIWLGDNWPGPYVVTVEKKRGHKSLVVVNGVRSIAEACAVAEAEFPMGEHVSVSIQPATVAEASHHPEVLAEMRAARALLSEYSPAGPQTAGDAK